ncbi:ArnT family glycosyltransferase [Micromonospora carbonacea]|uniref:Glycosyltransferase family 39 protein n=1 Tax=Micromonospora carbonacea TaxID=47853 RepID=A0A7H8XNJ7_9ACTN|nr:glycosyltransferase family 39 protein [Micromonospora carbonacea]MBB5826186.1 4-amino-4-deoxy-L-arabinose transferase-like glycosyltransferase [Micromonospora carbonacea]QLD25739.1 glycosyltransferase family 39 protein [Micromonospora carbonacea]
MDKTESLLTLPAPAPTGPTPTAATADAGPPARGRPNPAWVRPALAALLLATALLYLWGLGASGWANSFYSAAAQAGSQSWKAFFYGSSDAANSITVDKTPASLWLMALSVRVFGLNSWAILVPQALLGVASVGVLFATVRRWHGPAAGLIAGAVLAVTPVATLMFRFNNPDALLVLLLIGAAYATVRAVETASTRWIVLAGALVGFGFLTKMLQAFLVIPVFAGVYLLAAPTGFWRRVRQVLAAGLGVVLAAGWWVAIVELVPASARPYVGGSQGNSILELTLGYNGLGRITGAEEGSVGGRGPASGQTGLGRLFDTENGGQISWLLPAALILLVAGLLLAGRAARTDRRRAGLLLWGGWLLVTGVVFSFMSGIFHAYYSVALAPAVGALVGIGVTLLWQRRTAGVPRWQALAATVTLAAALAVTAWWSWRLLGRSPDWYPWLRTAVLAGGLAAAVLLVVADRLARRAVPVLMALGATAALAGPVAYSIQTAATPHTGSIPSAGPAVEGGSGPGRGGFPGGGRMRDGGQHAPGGQPPAFPGGTQGPGGQFPGFPGGGQGQNGGRGQIGGGQGRDGGQLPAVAGEGRAAGGGMGGLLDSREPSAELRALLEANAVDYTWVAATIGSQNASGYQLATGEPVMSIGGFNGSDPSPTLAQFQRYVAEGKIHYFVGGSGFRANGGSSASQEIATWVAETFEATTVDGVTVYDLTTGQEG